MNADPNHKDIFGQMFPELETDHGGVTLGDLVVLLLDAVLLIYTMYRSWHFLSNSIQADFQIMAILGLWGLDIAAVSWSLTWIFGSTTDYQDWISMGMFLLSLVGMGLTSLIDTLTYGAVLPPVMQTIAWYGIPLIILANVVAGFVYHMTSPSTRRRRNERKMQENLRKKREKGELELRRRAMEAAQARELIEQKSQVLASYQQLAEQKVALDQIEQGVIAKLSQSQAQQLPNISLDTALQQALTGQPETVENEPAKGKMPVPAFAGVTTLPLNGNHDHGGNHSGVDNYNSNNAEEPWSDPT